MKNLFLKDSVDYLREWQVVFLFCIYDYIKISVLFFENGCNWSSGASENINSKAIYQLLTIILNLMICILQ